MSLPSDYFTLKFLNYEGQQFSKYIPDLQQSVQLQFIVSQSTY